ncbi:hypothetical protein [Brevibacillus gelatini]
MKQEFFVNIYKHFYISFTFIQTKIKNVCYFGVGSGADTSVSTPDYPPKETKASRNTFSRVSTGLLD